MVREVRNPLLKGYKENSMGNGLLLVHTGNGKGKTIAALGLGLRAVDHGMKILMLQFFKTWKGF